MSAHGHGSVRVVEYLPGDRWLIAGDTAVIQLAGAPAHAMRWWPAVRAGASATDLIGQVYTDGVLGAGNGLSIVVVEGDAVRVLAQGETIVVVETVAGQRVTISGGDLLTWAEVVVPGAAVVHLDGPAALPEAGDLLPMPTGVVQAGAVRWQLVPVGAAVTPPAAAPRPAEVTTLDTNENPSHDADVPDDVVTVIAVVPHADHGAGGGAEIPDAAEDLDGAEDAGAVDDLMAEEPAPLDAAALDAAPLDAAPQDTVPPPVEVPHADVTQTVTEDELEELADRDPAAPSDDRPDRPADDQQTADDGTGSADGDLVGDPAAPASPPNPFPSLAVPPFTPPPFTPPPFTPPSGPSSFTPPAFTPPAFTTPPTDLPPVSVPPFVPASTSLPPISAVPGSALHQDSVPTGLPPVEPDPEPIPASTPPPPPTDGSADGDHDGHTQLAESLPAGYRPPPVPPAPQDGEVYAALCPSGHPNAPHSGNCRVCGSPIAAAEPVLTARPLLGRIRLSSGPSVDVDRRIVIGRSPSVSRVASSEMPRLVTVSSPHQDISRSHVEVRTEDWHLVVTDLHSTNGTLVRAPGRPDQLLHPGQAVVVDPGWTVDLGDGVSFVVEAGS